MSLRPNAVYRVDLRAPSSDEKQAGSPPKVVQIRLTEQALQQLANAYSSSSSIRIDVDPKDPVLVIGDTPFPLHAPVLASNGLPGKNSTTADAASTSTAPHELYKLSADESTLHRIGTISTKLSVKPTRDVSAVAQRLKQQKEEEEHRKEERRRALMQGASPNLGSSSSAKPGINKTMVTARGLSGSPSLGPSGLNRSSSLNKLSSRREPDLLHSSLSRGISREVSPAARASSSAAPHPKSELARHDDKAAARRVERAFTDSPKVSATTPSPSSHRLLEPDQSANSAVPSRIAPRRLNLDIPEEDDQMHSGALHTSPASAASDPAAKKSTKLTTRQRLAKATKAGSRLLAASERHATPERRTAPSTATQTSPPSKSGASVQRAVVESSKADPPQTARPHPPPENKPKVGSASAASPIKHETPVEDDRADAVPRKRRRTDDLDSTDFMRDRSERRSRTSSGQQASHGDDHVVQRKDTNRGERQDRVEPTSPRDGRASRSIPVSASMPSIAPMTSRLPPVEEVASRNARDSRPEAYRDRRRDRSYDEAHRDERATQNSDRAQDDERRGRPGSGHVRTLSGGPAPRSESAEVERPIRGVGPGATHWSEPWLNVRSKADWHRLAQRFRKMQEEYVLSRQRLEAENERLEWELELASMEEQTKSSSQGAGVPTGDSLLFSPHTARTGEDVHMDNVEVATAINTAINSRTRSNSRSKPMEDGDESPEEGEMRSSDGEADDTNARRDATVEVTRSESPDNLAWRSSPAKTQQQPGAEGADRPLGLAELADRVKQLEELHGSLSRMHRVLVEFKAKSVAAEVA